MAVVRCDDVSELIGPRSTRYSAAPWYYCWRITPPIREAALQIAYNFDEEVFPWQRAPEALGPFDERYFASAEQLRQTDHGGVRFIAEAIRVDVVDCANSPVIYIIE